jgi:hypothetical protein
LGQSYGGFCLTHYLSAASDGLAEVIITGGLPSLDHSLDDVYRATYRRVIEKNQRYYQRYPGDEERSHEIVDYLASHEVRLPSGDRLSPRRFQQLGLAFGASNGFEQVHYLLEEAFVRGRSGRELSYTFLRRFENSFSFQPNPIYALLHTYLLSRLRPQLVGRACADRIPRVRVITRQTDFLHRRNDLSLDV